MLFNIVYEVFLCVPLSCLTLRLILGLQQFRVTHKMCSASFSLFPTFSVFQGLVLQLAQANGLTSEPQTHRPHSPCLLLLLLLYNLKLQFGLL